MATGMSSERLQRIDQFFTENYIDTKKLPGAQILISRKGEVTHFSSLGMMDAERSKPTEDETIYRIYSMTKASCKSALSVRSIVASTPFRFIRVQGCIVTKAAALARIRTEPPAI
ncbi:MAG: serine hydrolase [Dehalococcoidia bacterium]